MRAWAIRAGLIGAAWLLGGIRAVRGLVVLVEDGGRVMRDSDAGSTHFYCDGCQPPHANPDWAVPSPWMDEDTMHREHAKNLRLEAEALAKRR